MLRCVNRSSSRIDGNAAPEQVRQHLATLLASQEFSTSKRCQEFLRYVVEEAVEDRGEDIKERNIAHEVFHKGAHFEPSEDSLVRVKAREVRKRLAQFYEAHPAGAIKIELPVGSYMPRFVAAGDPVAQPVPETLLPVPASRLSRRQVLWAFAGLAGTAVAAAPLVSLIETRSAPLSLLWIPVFATKTPLLIFVPVLTNDSGEITERVGLGTAATIGRAATFVMQHGGHYQLRFGVDLTFEQLREQPSLLLGGFSSRWTLWATQGLRYSLVEPGGWMNSYILDSKSGQRWKPVNIRPDGYADQDYGIVARLFDARTGQILLVAAGITTFGTEGAASVLFDPEAFDSVIRNAPAHWEKKNFEAVVKVSILGTTPSAPQIVTSHFW